MKNMILITQSVLRAIQKRIVLRAFFYLYENRHFIREMIPSVGKLRKQVIFVVELENKTKYVV